MSLITMTAYTPVALIFLVLVVLETSLEVAAQPVAVTNVTHSTAILYWDIDIEGANILTFQISVNCRLCVPFDVSQNATSQQLTGLRDNSAFEACVTPYTAAGTQLPSECVRFRTLFSPRTVGALCVGLFLVVSFFTLIVLDLMCRRHQIEVEDAKRDELLQQGWQTFKRSSTTRAARKKRASNAPPQAMAAAVAQGIDNDAFESLGDITLEEDLDDIR